MQMFFMLVVLKNGISLPAMKIYKNRLNNKAEKIKPAVKPGA